MPSWWEKSSSKVEKRTENRESIIDKIHQELKGDSQQKGNEKSRGSRRYKGPRSFVSSFAEKPHDQPLPHPGLYLPSAILTNSGINATPKVENRRGSKRSLCFLLSKRGYFSNRGEPADDDGDTPTASVSSEYSFDSDDLSDSKYICIVPSDYKNGKATIHSSLRVVHKVQSPITMGKNSRLSSEPAPQFCNNKLLSDSPKLAALHMQNPQIARPSGLWSATDSSMSSPSRSPMQTFGPEQVLSSGFCASKPRGDINSGQCYSSGLGHNSEQNAVCEDLSRQVFRPQNKCSPNCSPVPSPRMTSLALSPRKQSGAITPIHPRAGGTAKEPPTRRPDHAKQQTYQLPLPPLTITNTCPVSPTYSAATTPPFPHSPGSAKNLTSPSSGWKKGQLLGRGTFGHVYLGFNSVSGEMCAMKEVTLFSDDAKSKGSARHLGQEIALLGHLQHPNIVRYYGSEMAVDKLYIYLEYVSGGSVYKLLQQYGQFGEIAIRNYTRQILSGLAYLHAKNTVHRDIKGANILVDPNGVVKLADFGMAKHIIGQSSSWSLKGSPYWMAPEVINNSNGCNLAVDIWSLGCTVLEMATTKPPWSQYEGVAAMFKIGNSKELPAIPDNLSQDGKDFVRLCLQRNPLRRPSAAQLLMHPFVNDAKLERPIMFADPSETTLVVKNDAVGPAKLNLCLDPEVAGAYQERRFRIVSGSSDRYTPRTVSCPVSPTRSSHLPYGSPHVSGRVSPSPTSSPRTTTSSTIPCTGSNGAIPSHQRKLPTFSFEGLGVNQRPQNGLYSNGNTTYQVPKPDPFLGIQQSTHTCRHTASSNVETLGNLNKIAVQEDPRNFCASKAAKGSCEPMFLP